MENVNQTAIDSASTVFEKVGDKYIGSKSRFGDILIGAPYSEAFVKAYASERKDILVIPKTIEYTAFLRSDEMKEVAIDGRLAVENPVVSSQRHRDEIVEQAKADLEKLADEDGPVYQTEDNEGYPCSCYASFRVNKEHRTVACDLRGVRTGERYKRGIAKAAPSDCFNVHIGKAIALRRALGLAVPDEYLNAPQPTEVRVGDVVQYSKRCATVVAGRPNGFGETKLTTANGLATRIIDDSREEVGD